MNSLTSLCIEFKKNLRTIERVRNAPHIYLDSISISKSKSITIVNNDEISVYSVLFTKKKMHSSKY